MDAINFVQCVELCLHSIHLSSWRETYRNNRVLAGPSGRAVWGLGLHRLDAETVGFNIA
jgi:hypothetical protein